MNWLVEAMDIGQPGGAETAEPTVQSRVLPWQENDPANDWLCAWCHNRVASENDRFAYEGKGEFSFRNPEGIRFDILLFSRTMGCQAHGIPTSEHTWFPSHAWSFILCNQCGRHLGWHYTGPSEFAGLIKNRIVRAMLIWN